jgi:hypothetical protein
VVVEQLEHSAVELGHGVDDGEAETDARGTAAGIAAEEALGDLGRSEGPITPP